MAVYDTYKAMKTLTAAGFSETKAEAMLDAMGDSHDALATKADLNELAQATKADLRELALTTKADLNELELRMRLHLGAYVFAAAGLVIAVLLALEWLPR